ncbi:hypothetical protein [Stieleria neptunia]|nr:hypothetical protein [Stieleria neptunia]
MPASQRPTRSWTISLVALLVGVLCASDADAQILVGDSSVGYIDSAVLGNQVRLRFDAGYDSRFADRAEFVYAQYGEAGAPELERGIDNHQELSAYLEWQPLENLSLFTDVPFRWIDPVVNDNTGGLYDIQAGFKTALLKDDRSLLSAQLRGYFPTGDARSGLGTDHVSLEPALLGLFKASSRLTIESELRYWIPIGGSTASGIDGSGEPRDFSGDVLRYGLGIGYHAYQGSSVNVTSVTELVGWHVFDGLHSNSSGQRLSAINDAITNLKVGLRFSDSTNSLFVGYGTVLTDSRWYSDIIRFELRHAF